MELEYSSGDIGPFEIENQCHFLIWPKMKLETGQNIYQSPSLIHENTSKTPFPCGEYEYQETQYDHQYRYHQHVENLFCKLNKALLSSPIMPIVCIYHYGVQSINNICPKDYLPNQELLSKRAH